MFRARILTLNNNNKELVFTFVCMLRQTLLALELKVFAFQTLNVIALMAHLDQDTHKSMVWSTPSSRINNGRSSSFRHLLSLLTIVTCKHPHQGDFFTIYCHFMSKP